MPVVSDASSLIVLAQIGKLNLLAGLFSRIAIPPAVQAEIPVSIATEPWLSVSIPSPTLLLQAASKKLHPGETEAIALAIHSRASLLIVDDAPARKLCRELGVPITGTGGVLLLLDPSRTPRDAIRVLEKF